MLCGHYKGVDERVRSHLVDEEFSVGEYILSGGELPALVLVDGVARLVPGVLGDARSAGTDSFEGDLLDCPYYTRPDAFEGLIVPEVLLSGNHQEIAAWRRRAAEERTRGRRNAAAQQTPRESEGGETNG